MKRLAPFGILVLVVIGLLLLGISNRSFSIADTRIPDNELASTISEANNSRSAHATITITWTTAPSEGS